jgi:threonylcarbamoyladenosine tRNA methylthiotransferase MtaB
VNDISRHKEYEDMSILSFENHTRGFIKIQEGCREFCTYCIIPYARGPIRSRSIDSILKEANELAKSGFKEVVLTGIHVSSYGKDLKNIELIDVIKEINNIEGIKRIRLGSLEPMHTTVEFIEKITKYNKVCPHFHISLQSGCDQTLKRMNRKYSVADYKNIIDKIENTMNFHQLQLILWWVFLEKRMKNSTKVLNL